MDLASGTGITYRHFRGPVLYPFGWGLSYTNFSYNWSNASIRERTLDTISRTPVDHEVTVTNSGRVTGDCVVLAFILSDNFHLTNRDEQGAPLRKLFGFRRLKAMQPGEQRSVLFSSTALDLSVVDGSGARWLKPRRVRIEIGDVVAPATDFLEIRGEDVLLEAVGPWAGGLGH